MIDFFKTNIGKEEIKATQTVLKSGNLTLGSQNLNFENFFLNKIMQSKKHNLDACAVSSCTSALLISLRAVGVKKNDEVIIPTLSFAADASVVMQICAKPVFCDSISQENWNIDPKDIEKKITKKTKAIIIVHFAGFPCDIKSIKKISKYYKIPVIEDSCHALFSKYKNCYVGKDFDLATFSFYGNKNLTTGEGGMVIGKKKYINRIKNLRSHGIIRDFKVNKFYPGYEINEYGYNFRMTEMQAALGVAQLNKIDSFNEKRRQLYKFYIKKIHETNLNITLPFQEFNNEKFSYHIFPILLPEKFVKKRKRIIQKLFNMGIATSIHYIPIHKFKAYKKFKCSLKVVDSFCDRIITLPLYPSLKKSEIKYIINSLKKVLKFNRA